MSLYKVPKFSLFYMPAVKTFPLKHLQFYEPFNTGYNFQIFCLCGSLFLARLQFFTVSTKTV